MSPRERFVRRGGYIYEWKEGASFRAIRPTCVDCADLNPRTGDTTCTCPAATEAELHAAALKRAFDHRRNT